MLYLSLHGMYNGLINVTGVTTTNRIAETIRNYGRSPESDNSPRSRTNAAVRFDMYGIPARPRPE